MLSAVVGVNWGDEGKGRMVDLLSETQDIVVRYQGGNNAGHTVVTDFGEFIFNLLPSGILRENVVCVLGPGMAIDLAHLDKEIKGLAERGIKITPDRLKISDKAIVTMPYHVSLDGLEEDRLAGKKYGSTRRGIAPVYSDKYLKKAVRTGNLTELELFAERLEGIIEYKNLTLTEIYGAPAVSASEMLDYLKKYAEIFTPYLCDTGIYLTEAYKAGKNIMFEAQLGALRDIDYGIYPYTSSSTTLAAYAPIGAGVPGLKLDKTLAIMKAYSSCVGEGPFVTEYFGEEADKLRGEGGEYGAATKRPRRVGPFDAVASRYGVRVQGGDEVALTKLDIISYMDKIPVCIAYVVDGKRYDEFFTGEKLNRAKPVYEYHEGWQCDISKCRKKSDLPKAALDYIYSLEKYVGVKIKYVSVGAERDAYVTMDN
jgi:adenylosuccinate synthase